MSDDNECTNSMRTCTAFMNVSGWSADSSRSSCDLQLSSLCPSPSSLVFGENYNLLTPVQVQTRQLALFRFARLPLSPSLSGDRSTLRGARHDRFRCHLTATRPSAAPTRSRPLPRTLSCDLLRCGHDRCGCHRVRLVTS